jgi:hypothetical protein
MKNYLLISLAFLLLLGCKSEKKDQASPKHVTIYLFLIKEIPDGVTDLKDYIQFYVEGEDVGSIIGKPEEFTTIVSEGDKVKWKSAKESIHKIKIKDIIFKPTSVSIDILESGNTSPDPDEVEKTVKKNNVGDIEFYGLEIEIGGNPYKIDPKLEYH